MWEATRCEFSDDKFDTHDAASRMHIVRVAFWHTYKNCIAYTLKSPAYLFVMKYRCSVVLPLPFDDAVARGLMATAGWVVGVSTGCCH